ncbi:helix-turn-helix domain-containing protein [Clostridium sp. UBA7339]|uniref:helix-turn-helix domain-containing protein n=1 Tax=Clostridium sp. UBA7339 TaxID=1946376 RepID=UPI00321715A2
MELEKVLISRKSLAERWDFNTESILKYEQDGVLTRNPNFEAPRYYMEEIIKIESLGEVNPLSPLERRRLEKRKIKELKQMDKAWYSVEEVSKLLGVSKQTVRDKLATKEITGTKIGREWRILKDEVNSILGISNKVDEKDQYIKELESKIEYLTLQNESFKNIANSLVKIIS